MFTIHIYVGTQRPSGNKALVPANKILIMVSDNLDKEKLNE